MSSSAVSIDPGSSALHSQLPPTDDQPIKTQEKEELDGASSGDKQQINKNEAGYHSDDEAELLGSSFVLPATEQRTSHQHKSKLGAWFHGRREDLKLRMEESYFNTKRLIHERKVEAKQQFREGVRAFPSAAARFPWTAGRWILDHRGILLILLITLMSEANRGLTFSTQEPWLTSLGGSKFLLGFGVASFSLGRVIATPLAGYIADKFSFRSALVASMALCVLGNIMYMFTSWAGKAMLILSRWVVGFGAGTLGITRAYVALVTSPSTRTSWYAVHAACQFIGLAITPGIGTAMVQAFLDKLPNPTPAVTSSDATTTTPTTTVPDPNAPAQTTAATDRSDASGLDAYAMPGLWLSVIHFVFLIALYFLFNEPKKQIQEVKSSLPHGEKLPKAVPHAGGDSEKRRSEEVALEGKGLIVEMELDGGVKEERIIDVEACSENDEKPGDEEQGAKREETHVAANSSQSLSTSSPASSSSALSQRRPSLENISPSHKALQHKQSDRSWMSVKSASGSDHRFHYNPLSWKRKQTVPTFPLSGSASHVLLAKAGSTKAFASRVALYEFWLLFAFFLFLNFSARMIMSVIETLGTPMYRSLVNMEFDTAEIAGAGNFFTELGLYGLIIFAILVIFGKFVSDRHLLLGGMIAMALGSAVLIGFSASNNPADDAHNSASFARFTAGCVFIYSFGYPLAQTVLSSMVSKILGKSNQGMMQGHVANAGSAGRIVGPLLAGALADLSSYGAAFGLSLVFNVLTVMLLIFFYPRLKSQKEKEKSKKKAQRKEAVSFSQKVVM